MTGTLLQFASRRNYLDGKAIPATSTPIAHYHIGRFAQPAASAA